jgi:hypothetical protein
LIDKRILFLLVFFSCSENNFNKNIIGYWEGSTKDLTISLDANKLNVCKITFINNDTDSITIIGKYEINLSKNPIPFSIKNIDQLDYQLHTIINFISPDKIEMGKFSTKWRLRPIVINKDEKIILTRKN